MAQNDMEMASPTSPANHPVAVHNVPSSPHCDRLHDRFTGVPRRSHSEADAFCASLLTRTGHRIRSVRAPELPQHELRAWRHAWFSVFSAIGTVLAQDLGAGAGIVTGLVGPVAVPGKERSVVRNEMHRLGATEEIAIRIARPGHVIPGKADSGVAGCASPLAPRLPALLETAKRPPRRAAA